MTAFPCIGRSYLSAGRAEVDAPMELTIECDGGRSGDCGWRVVISQKDWERPEGPWDVTITSDLFLPLHQQHLDYRADLTGRVPSPGDCATCGAGDWNGWDDCPEHSRPSSPEGTRTPTPEGNGT